MTRCKLRSFGVGFFRKNLIYSQKVSPEILSLDFRGFLEYARGYSRSRDATRTLADRCETSGLAQIA